MMKRPLAILLAAATATLLAACTSEPEPEQPPPLATPSATTTYQPRPTATEDLPSVDNTDVDMSDPSDVAYNFILLSTTFMPGDVFNPMAASERGYPLATDRYREEHTPATNTEVVRIRAWYNQRTTDDDPVSIVESTVEHLTRPVPPTPDATKATRHLRSTQTPVTESGRTLPPRGQDATLHLIKLDDGHWLVDDATYTVMP